MFLSVIGLCKHFYMGFCLFVGNVGIARVFFIINAGHYIFLKNGTHVLCVCLQNTTDHSTFIALRTFLHFQIKGFGKLWVMRQAVITT